MSQRVPKHLRIKHEIASRKSGRISFQSSDIDSPRHYFKNADFDNYCLIAQHSTEIIARLTFTGKILYISPACCKVLGYSPEAMIDHSILDFVHPEDCMMLREFQQERYAKNRPQKLSYRVRRKDGQFVWVESTFKAILQRHSFEIGEIIAVTRDISDRKQVEESLKILQKRFYDLFHDAPVMYVMTTNQGGEPIVSDCNALFLKSLGYSREEVIHSPMTKFYTPASCQKLLRGGYLRALKGKFVEEERDLVKRDGTVLHTLLRASPEINSRGEVTGTRAMFIDITETKRLHEALARAQRLETAGQIAGQIAHDFNNILSPLTAYPGIIREELPDNHPAITLINDLEAAALKISEINQQLLCLGRRGHYSMEPVNLNTLIKDALRSVDLPAKVKLKIQLSSQLLNIKAGATQLTRVLINLLTNAIEAMEGEGVLFIETKNIYLDQPLQGYQTIRTGDYVQLEITDTGSGIAPEIFDKIFDPFFTTKKMDRQKGSGLGLSVVHGIVEDHHGYITVNSKPGEGTTFSLYFPVTRQWIKHLENKTTKMMGGNEKILVVDDDPTQRKVMSRLLKHLGYQVHIMPNGERAIKYFQKNPQDLLILDMVMEDMDGTETYQHVLEINPGQKAIILSGHAMTERGQMALRLGAGAFISKPVTLESLARAVRKELDKKKK